MHSEESQSEQIEDRLRSILVEAQEIRARISEQYPSSGASTAEVLASLQAVRPFVDSLEALVVAALRIRGATERAMRVAQAAIDDGWDAQATTERGFAARDLAPRERYARYHLEIFAERTALRDAERLHSRASEVYDAVRLIHRGADAVRSDLHVMIRAAQFESTLER